jgi:hypothetical protein
MSISSFRVKCPRPEKLSDPGNDFSPNHLKEILATPDRQMERRHYINLFGPYLPAGTYKESIYFLPGAFHYLLAHDGDALDLITPILGFISVNKTNLIQDGIFEDVCDCVRECLNYWTRDFRVIHYDKKACREKGWGINYFDHVEMSEVVGLAISDLVEFEKLAIIAVEFVRDLASNDDPVKAAWFLEYSHSQKYPAYYPPNYEPITRLINDDERLLAAMYLVEQHIVPNEPSPTYWEDTFRRVGL